MGERALSDGPWLSAFQGRLINFEKRRKVSLLGKGWVLGGGQDTWLCPPPVIFIGKVGDRWGESGARGRIQDNLGRGLFEPSSENRAGRGGPEAGGHHPVLPSGARNSKSSPRSSCSSRPATITASRPRSSSGPGSRPWSGSARLRGEPGWELGGHRWAVPEQLPRACGLGSWCFRGWLGPWTPPAGRPREGDPHVAPGSLSRHRSCSYNLSCELEPPSESASNTLRVKKNAAIVKRWSE